ncbi:MAG: hypothetical protein IJ220_03035 [Clostridia bacterium]|nr:hypothetical protein [Clostridia bacterium]
MYIFNSLSDYFHYISQNKSNHILKRLLLSLWGFSSDDFSNYNLSKRRFRRVINEFVPYYRRIHYRGNKECISFQILNNKFETIKLLKKHHIPTTTPRYIFSKKMGFLVDEQCQIISKATGILSGDYVLKPIHSRWGSWN